MKVLHVITDLDIGGAETMLAALVTARRPEAPEQSVASLIDGGALRARLEGAGIRVRSLGMARGRASPEAMWRLARILRAERPDCVQGWMYHADLVATAAWLIAGRRQGVRLFWGVRCSDMDPHSYGRRLRLVIAASARLSRLPDAVVANAESGRRHHLRLGYRPRRFVVIPNGIDTDRFRPDPHARRAIRAELGIDAETPVLAHVARVDAMKDHATLLAALEALPGVAVLAVGTGTEGLPARPRLFRLGPRSEMPAIYAASDLVVSTSAFGEGFSNVLAEGMASGLPAVATDVGDAAEIVGECGRIVPPRDPAALAAAVTQVLKGEHRAVGVQARLRIAGRYALAGSVAAFDALHRGEDPERCAA